MATFHKSSKCLFYPHPRPLSLLDHKTHLRAWSQHQEKGDWFLVRLAREFSSFSRTAGEGGELARRVRVVAQLAGQRLLSLSFYFRPRAIDLSGGFLMIVTFSGLALSLLMKKTRQTALITAGAGALLMLLLIWMTN